VEILPFDEAQFAPLFGSAVVAMQQVLEQFSPEERDVVERFEREVQRLMRADILGENATA
jgi:hypothetical protein